jgi:hypothetical protein
MNGLGGPDHSELEVNQERLTGHSRISRKPVATQSVDKEVVRPNEKEVVGVNATNNVGEVAAATLPTRRSFWRKKRVIVIGIILLCVVVAAVVGGVVGGTQHKSSTSSTSGSPGTSTSTVSSRTATTSSIASQTSSATSSPSPIVPRPNSNLAAVAWNVSDTLGQIRVYYQDDQGNIQEAARNTPDSTWTVKTLTTCTVPAKNGTTIAAAFRQQAQSSQDSVGLM